MPPATRPRTWCGATPNIWPACASVATDVAAFLFSAAGNDVIGEDEFGEPVLKSLVKSFTAGKDAAWHVNQMHLGEVLLFLEGAYNEVVATIRAEFPALPV